MAKEFDTTHSLASLFPNQTILDVLTLLLLHPDQEFYQREISERTSTGTIQVQRALKRIQAAGLALSARRGNRIYYTSDTRHPAHEDLKRVLIKTVGLGDQLRKCLEPHHSKIRLSFIYGSLATGKENRDSDIDLIIVGELTSRQATKILGPLGREMDREFNATLYPEKEFRSKLKRGNRFIQQVVSESKIWLIGNEDELRELVG
jgi:uncharacterized protein